MYAPHFAAALAVKSRVPRAPLVALLVGAFLPDLIWTILARIGVESASQPTFFDDWSHSLISVVVMATLFAALFWRRGRVVGAAVWVAVFSHSILDFPVHPKRLALYPGAHIHLGWNLLTWGSSPGWLGAINDWWLQFFVLGVLLVLYCRSIRRTGVPGSVMWASCALLIGLQLLMLAPCIGY